MIKASYSKRTLIFKQPAGTSRGVLLEKDSFFLSLFHDDNPLIKGVGEISPIPGLSIDEPSRLENKIIEVIDSINTGNHNFNMPVVSFPAIQFGVETALISLGANSSQILFPSDFTSGKVSIPINGLIWMGSREFMEQQIEAKIKAGFRCLKLKIGAIDFETELSVLKSIRGKYPSELLELRVDANGAFNPADAYDKLSRLAELELHSIEQPIKAGQYEEMSRLCAASPLPIALDEELIGVFPYEKKKQLLETIKPQYIILKPTLLGGFKASSEWIELAGEEGIGWWVTSALESNIGLNAIAQWTATLGNPSFQGLGTGALYKNNIESPLTLRGGRLYYSV